MKKQFLWKDMILELQDMPLEWSKQWQIINGYTRGIMLYILLVDYSRDVKLMIMKII